MQIAYAVFIVVLLALLFIGFFTDSRDMQVTAIMFGLLGIIVMLGVSLFAELRGSNTEDTPSEQHTTTETTTVTTQVPQP